MHYSVNESDTLYAITYRLNKDIEDVPIGKLGRFNFPKGYYVYVGSAKRNIVARIGRHMKIDKKNRWHIDYLRPYLDIQSVQSYPEQEGECQLFQNLMLEHRGNMPVKGFGSSDCKCYAHLFYYEA
ncbi:GIY-YIG nuclease family protein [Amphibacillus sp. MSJ-3]|uniref:GIY-YIG nuclease family protein n=1 Tax=Amphibacillus sp. MSJ-3 TaxID=2841505 RepID=UPI001C0EA89F|nr:GIY-YIG nuclease family protein [Amphibacillus sp. MSJ-3]